MYCIFSLLKRIFCIKFNCKYCDVHVALYRTEEARTGRTCTHALTVGRKSKLTPQGFFVQRNVNDQYQRSLLEYLIVLQFSLWTQSVLLVVKHFLLPYC